MDSTPSRDAPATWSWPDALVVSHSGIRGRSMELTPSFVANVVASFARVLDQGGLPASVAVARDERAEGAAFCEHAAEAAQAAGLDVVDLGAVSTPTAKLAARLRGLGGAVIITGSHLGPEWNGIKLAVAPRFEHFDPRSLPAPVARTEQRGNRRADPGAAHDHAAAIAASVDAEAIRAARLAVQVNGGAGAAADVLLELLGCIDAPRADVGLLLDPDGDRLQLADESGAPVDTEVTLPLVMRARHSRRVVVGYDTSRTVEAVAREEGADVHRVIPGEAHLSEAVRRLRADLAGEGNGGVVVPAVSSARDGLAAAASILELRARTGRPLSTLAAGVPVLARRRSTVPLEDRLAALPLLRRIAAVDDPYAGAHIEHNGAWGLARLSATEPLLRITTEAADAGHADALHEELRETLTRP